MSGVDFKLTPVKKKKKQSRSKELGKSVEKPIVRSQARLVKEERGMITRESLAARAG